ncbi:MAG: hypothetical protein A2Y33_09900 [Spirochaetes bacterium GWF1_51_8]|nr:MAG: hypothetical protein A2Y33_09900 [Spirochaetes bacterium GWF1_51_8]
MKRIVFTGLLLLSGAFFGGNIFADDLGMNEDDMFKDSEMMVDTNTVIKDNVAAILDQDSVNFSGNILSRTSFYMTKQWLEGLTDGDKNLFTAKLEGNFILDIRLRMGFKAFVNLAINYNTVADPYAIYGAQYILLTNLLGSNAALLDATGDNTEILLKEVFMDMNIDKSVYFRLGKQVLQWGQGYFWNPTDLLNSELKSFSDMSKMREGSFGFRIHIPIESIFNFYAFIDARDVEKFTDFAIAGKVQFLVGITEFGLSAWAKKGFYPVYGVDFTTSLFGIDLRGEMSISYGDNHHVLGDMVVMGPYTNYTVASIEDRWVPRISLGFTKTFDWDVQDRIMLVGEFYYNDSGYYENVFKDPAKKQALFINNLYQPNYHSAYYGALFISIGKFPINDMSFSVNALGNFNDYSFTVVAGLSYTPVMNFTLGFNIYGFLGEDDCEFTMSGNRLALEATAKVVF